MKRLKIILLGFICLVFPGCNNNSIDEYEKKSYKIDFRSFFQGDVEGWGAIFDYRGVQTRSFYVKIKGTWNGNSGILEEWFDFDDGEKLERKWDLTFSEDGAFVGKAKDVIGSARGKQKGNAVHSRYTLQIPYKDSTIDLNMNDWMYLISGGGDMVLNRAEMKKYGFKVGEMVIFLRKRIE